MNLGIGVSVLHELRILEADPVVVGQVTTAQSPAVTYSYAYDAAHRMQRVTDSRGNKTLSYAWSPGGKLNTLQDNDGHRTDYLYDPVGRLSGIWAANDDYVSFAYDAAGRLAEKWFPNGVNAIYTWNADNTLAELKNRVNYSDSAMVSRHDYTYNGIGLRISAEDTVGGATPPAANDAYAYDPVGNRTAKDDGTTPLYYVYDAANQLKETRQTNASGSLLAAMVYDANGNLTRKCEGGSVSTDGTTCSGNTVTGLGYNALDQLVQVSKTGQSTQTYAYDDQGRRIKKAVGASSPNYLYNGSDIEAEYQNQNWN